MATDMAPLCQLLLNPKELHASLREGGDDFRLEASGTELGTSGSSMSQAVDESPLSRKTAQPLSQNMFPPPGALPRRIAKHHCEIALRRSQLAGDVRPAGWPD